MVLTSVLPPFLDIFDQHWTGGCFALISLLAMRTGLCSPQKYFTGDSCSRLLYPRARAFCPYLSPFFSFFFLFRLVRPT
jgi:hypothetical protein